MSVTALTAEQVEARHAEAPTDVGQAAQRQGFGSIPELQQAIDERAGYTTAARSGLVRAPFIFTRLGRREAAEGGSRDYTPSGGVDFDLIYAELNPSQYSFQLKTRELLEKCGGGEVLHSFEASEERAEQLGKYLDEVPITYTLNTGNCIPIKLTSGGLLIPPGLSAYYALLELLLEDPRVLSDGRSNDLIITQTSLIFPSLTVTAKLDPGGITHQEDAQNPAEIRGFSFTVSARSIFPRITNHAALEAEYAAASFGQ